MNKPRSTIEIRCHRANSWIGRAENLSASDLDGKFIFYWIAINALYGQPKYLGRTEERTNDLTDLQTFLNTLFPLDEHGHILGAIKSLEHDINQLLKERYLCDWCWKYWQANKLVTADERNKDSCSHQGKGHILNRLFGRLYVLRKQLFHGCSSEGGSKNRHMLKQAVNVLEKLARPLQELVRERGKCLTILKTLSYPPTI